MAQRIGDDGDRDHSREACERKFSEVTAVRWPPDRTLPRVGDTFSIGYQVYDRGCRVVLPWYRRAWTWLCRRVLRRRRPMTVTFTPIDTQQHPPGGGQ